MCHETAPRSSKKGKGVDERTPPAIGDGESTVSAKGTTRDLGTRRVLAAFVLCRIGETYDSRHRDGIEAHGHEFASPSILLDVAVKDRVKNLVVG